jgi:hypothetical protein
MQMQNECPPLTPQATLENFVLSGLLREVIVQMFRELKLQPLSPQVVEAINNVRAGSLAKSLLQGVFIVGM